MTLNNTHYSDTLIPGIFLSELIDIDNVRSMMESFHELTGIPMALADLKGNFLAGAGWQDICTKFHRVEQGTHENCIASDISLTAEIPEGEFRLYKCRNGMWDMATPLYFGKHRIGILFSGQFFFTDEKVDVDFFISQAERYNFDPGQYLEALQKVPRVERNYIQKAESFFIKLAATLADLGYNRMKLEKALEDTRVLLSTARHNKFLLEQAQSIAHLGSWEFDLRLNRLTWSEEVYKIFGIDPLEFEATYEGFLAAIHPDDRESVQKAYSESVAEERDSYEIEHRVIRKSDGEIRRVHEKCKHFRDREGHIVKSVGMVHDITKRKRSETHRFESKMLVINKRHYFRHRMTRLRKKTIPGIERFHSRNKKRPNGRMAS